MTSPSPSSPSQPTPPSPTPIPLDSPTRTHPKRLLPPSLNSTYPHGHISGHPRTGAQLASFNARKQEIVGTMSVEDIEKRYEEVAGRVVEVLEEGERKGREVEAAMENRKLERDMEKRVHERFGVKGR